MSAQPETSIPSQEPRAVPEFDRDRDRTRMRSIAALHGAAVIGALTLWGAADAWATTSDWSLAWATAFANAILAAYVIAGIAHEWGHFAGARLAGSFSPVHAKPVRYFFMFDFPFEHNDRRQFLWMSLGGILTPWLLVLATAALVPIDNASRALLLAAFVTRAVQISVFEVPVVARTAQGGEPREELGRQLVSGFRSSRYAGLAVGALVWLVA